MNQEDLELISKSVDAAHNAYLQCSPVERLWVLKNRSEWLFMPGHYDKKLVQQAIRQLELECADVDILDIHPNLKVKRICLQ